MGRNGRSAERPAWVESGPFSSTSAMGGKQTFQSLRTHQCFSVLPSCFVCCLLQRRQRELSPALRGSTSDRSSTKRQLAPPPAKSRSKWWL
jgi:hypothetical protein